jgi:hypothetical protein
MTVVEALALIEGLMRMFPAVLRDRAHRARRAGSAARPGHPRRAE